MGDRILFTGARLVDPAGGVDEIRDVLVSGGEIEAVAEAAEAAASTAERIDADGLVIAPGFVDLHTHLREPGGEDRETIETGTRAAALGGFTAVSAMANTEPVADSAAVIQEVQALAAKAGWCDVLPVGAITRGLEGERLTEIGEMASLGVRMFSDDGRCVPDSRTLRMALEYARTFDVVIADHCQDASLSEDWQMHEGPASSMLGLAGTPGEAEEVVVWRDLLVAGLTGGRLHLCHLSSAGSLDALRAAKARGLRVTGEVTPHHLTFVDEDLAEYDTNLKVNPPLRGVADRDALRSGLADGTIDAVATDHAPHAAQDKERAFAEAPAGMIGLETALAAVMTAAGDMPLSRLVETLSAGPARVLGLADQGGPVEPGRPANLVVFDPEATWTVAPPFASRSSNSGFIGRTLRGRVLHTVYRGELVVRGGEAVR